MAPNPATTTEGDAPEYRLRHRGSNPLTDLQVARRRKVIDRIRVANGQVWVWTGQSKTARGRRYPQVLHSPGNGVKQLVNARHVIYYLATGWTHEGVQQYRSRDGDPMNVHPDNLHALPPLTTERTNNNFWDTERLRDYYG